MAVYTPTQSDNNVNMKLLYFSNEFPHDDLHNLSRRLLQHSKTRQHPILARFLEEATRAVREEVRELPAHLKPLIPPFETILNFVDFGELRKSRLCGAVDGIILCAVELGAFIGYLEKHPEEDDFDLARTSLAGLGIGLLATAAVSLAPTLNDLPLTGAEVVRQAFRLGVLVDDVSYNLHPRDLADTSPPDTWACVLPDASAEQVQSELDLLHAREKTPTTSKIFISAISATSVTISGPPARLKGLFRGTADFFRDRKFVALPVFGGLCHAEHIYNDDHVRLVVGTRSMELLDQRFLPRVPVYSTSTGRPFPAKKASDLFEHIIREILTQKIQWDAVIQGVKQHTQDAEASYFQLYIFRQSLPVHDLTAALTKLGGDLETSTKELIPWLHDNDDDTAQGGGPRGPLQSKIAIVGMSCRMPGGATDTEKFWELLENGLDVHRKIPADRFDVDSHYDPAGKRVNASHTPYGCFIDEPGLFDAPFFNMSPREAQQTDPMQRLALVTAYEALERAGYVANRTAATNLHRIGTFYGQASDDYREVNTAQEISTYFIPGGCRAFGPGRINYFFKFSGPSYSIDTACSSSLATIQTACTSLWAGDTDMAVAGGMNVLSNSDAFAGLSHGHFLSKTPNACKTWDCEADGYCRADGVGSIVMKRLEDAEADNDNILGVILAAGTNHSAEAVSITHPHAGHQADLGRQIISRAGIDPLDVGFVEMHGTGTQAGDAEEIQSVTDVFAPLSGRRNTKNPLYIGAVKANVGHGEAAAGVTALLKVLLMLQKNAIPPHVGIKNSLNPKFPKDMEKRNLRIPYELTKWPHVPGKKRIAVVNNFSAAGGNSTVVLEEGPVRGSTGVDPRPKQVVAVSAKSKISLKGNLERMIGFLDKNPDVSLADLSYSTTARRHHHNHRVTVVASDISQVRQQLRSALGSVDSDSRKPIPSTGQPPVVFTFTGQGASHRSMNLELFHNSPYFQSQLLHLDRLAQGQGFPSFIPAVDGSYPSDHAHSPVITQLALVSTEIALAKYWASLGVSPDVVIGHSLGEYTALHVAGVLSASDTVFLVGQRALILEKKCKAGSHTMLAVRASLAQIQESTTATDNRYEVACINGPKDTVLSGTREQIDALSQTLEGHGYKCFRLDVAFAFHSEQTDPILDEFEEMAKTSVVFRRPNLPIISPLLGKVIFDDRTITANYLRRATREPVDFLSALENAQKVSIIDENMVWVEIGPHPVCVNFVKSTLPSVNVIAASLRRNEDNWSTIAQSLSAMHNAGVEINWNEFHRPFERAGALRLLDLPTYSWNDKTYWIMYNGDWALTKGNTFYDAEKALKAAQQQQLVAPLAAPQSSLRTSTVQQIIKETFSGSGGKVVMRSDLMQADFLAAANGHNMNGCGVVTSSIHADIAFTLGQHFFKKLRPDLKKKDVHMSVANLEVLKGLVAQKTTRTPQLIQVSISSEDIHSNSARLFWHNVSPDGVEADEPFASADLYYGDADEWLASWLPLTHLVQGRIEALERLADEGVANRLSHNMAYLLFASNLVDYADKYRGMQSVVLHELEAFADVTLTTGGGGVWTVPPHFIDSVAHLAGFVMNVSDAIDTRANFCVTPGWGSMRFAKPLVAGAKYRSYVKMIPTAEDPSVYLGDVYILQDGIIIGMVGAIKFRRYPRLLLNRFFSAPDGHDAAVLTTAHKAPAPALPTASSTSLLSPLKKPVVIAEITKPAPIETVPALAPAVPAAITATATISVQDVNNSTSTAVKAVALVAEEAGLELSELTDEATFANLGVDSLMSLVIAEKFREQLGVTVNGSLFLEYPTVGDLRAWLVEYYS